MLWIHYTQLYIQSELCTPGGLYVPEGHLRGSAPQLSSLAFILTTEELTRTLVLSYSVWGHIRLWLHFPTCQFQRASEVERASSAYTEHAEARGYSYPVTSGNTFLWSSAPPGSDQRVIAASAPVKLGLRGAHPIGGLRGTSPPLWSLSAATQSTLHFNCRPQPFTSARDPHILLLG